MPLPLREIDKKLADFKQRGVVPKNMNIQEFSKIANEVTGTQDFNAGDIGTIGRGAIGLNKFINERIENSRISDLLNFGTKAIPGIGTVMPFVNKSIDAVTNNALSTSPTFREMGEDVGGFAGKMLGNEEIGREVGAKLPRGVANMAGFFTGVGGALPFITTAAAQGLDTYGETGSLPRAALSGGVAAAIPGAMKAVGEATMPFVANQIGNVGARIASVPLNAATGFGLGIAGDVGDITLAPERSFAEMGQKEYWQAHGVGQLAFLPLDVQQAFALKLPPRAGTTSPPPLSDLNPVRLGSGISDRIDVTFNPRDEFRVTSDMVEFAQKPMELMIVDQPPKQRMAPRFDNMQGTRNAPEVEGDLLSDFGIQKAPVSAEELRLKLQQHPIAQEREALFQQRSKLHELWPDDPVRVEQLPAIEKRLEELKQLYFDLPENKAWWEAYQAEEAAKAQKEFLTRKNKTLKNFESKDVPPPAQLVEDPNYSFEMQRAAQFGKIPTHSTDINDLPSILENGLKAGSALDTTPDRGWAGAGVTVVVPDAGRGAHIEHNNYYQSANTGTVTRVIVDQSNYSNDVMPQIRELANKHPQVKFEVIGGDGRITQVESDVARMSQELSRPPVSQEVENAMAKVDQGKMDPETLIKEEPEIYNEIERKQTQDATSSLGKKLEPDQIPYENEQLPKVAEIIETPPTTPDEFTQQIKSVNKERALIGQEPATDFELQRRVENHIESGDDNQTAVHKALQQVKNETLRFQQIREGNINEVQKLLDNYKDHPNARRISEWLSGKTGGKGSVFDQGKPDELYLGDVQNVIREYLTRENTSPFRNYNAEFEGLKNEIKNAKRRAERRLSRAESLTLPDSERFKKNPHWNVAETYDLLEKANLTKIVSDKVLTKSQHVITKIGEPGRNITQELNYIVGKWIRQKGYRENPITHLSELDQMLEARIKWYYRDVNTKAANEGFVRYVDEMDYEGMRDYNNVKRTAEDGYDAMVLHRVIKHNNEFLTGAEPLFRKNENGKWVFEKKVHGKWTQFETGGTIDEAQLRIHFMDKNINWGVFEAAKLASPGIIDGAGKVDLEALTNTLSDPDFVRTQVHADNPESTLAQTQFREALARVDQIQHQLEIFGFRGDELSGIRNVFRSASAAYPNVNEMGDFLTIVNRLAQADDIGPIKNSIAKILNLPESHEKFFDLFDAIKNHSKAVENFQGIPKDENFAQRYGDVAPDSYVEFDPKTGLGNTAVEVRVKGLEGYNPHTDNTDTLLWVRGKFIEHNGRKIYRVDEIQSDAAQSYFKTLNALKKGEPRFAKDESGTPVLFRGFQVDTEMGKTIYNVETNTRFEKGQFFDKTTNQVLSIEQVRQRAINNYQKESYHPFYDHINQIALRTAIQHAGKTGATEIFLPSAKTAMFSEGHQHVSYYTYPNKPTQVESLKGQLVQGKPLTGEIQWSNENPFFVVTPPEGGKQTYSKTFLQPEQLKMFHEAVGMKDVNPYKGGMEYAYDNKLPAGMSKLVGKGEQTVLGKHQNEPIQNDPTFGDNSITGTLYKIKPLYDQFQNLGGTPLFGRPELHNAFVQRHPIERLAMANGYSPEQAKAHTPFVLAVTKLFETLTGQKLKIGEIIGRTNDGNMVAGLANRSAIHRAIFLNPELEPNLAGFTAAHEAIGHHMMNLHKAGMLDPEMSRSIIDVTDFWTKLQPSDREEFFRNYGPELLGKDLYSQVAETLKTTSADPNESMANLMAMLSKDSVSKFLTLERLSFLPQPVMNFVLKGMQFAKDLFRIAKSWLGMRNILGDVEAEKFKTLWDFERNFSDQYKKISAENYKLTREAYKLGQLFPGGRDGEGYAGKVLAEMLDFNGNEAVNMVADAMLIPGWSQARSGMRKLSEFMEPTLTKLARYPIVQKWAGLATFVEAQLGHMIDNAQVDFLFRDPSKPKNTGGFSYMKNGGPVMEIFNDLKPDGLHHRFNELWRLQNSSKDIFLDGTNVKDPQFKTALDGLSDAQIKTMIDANLRFREAIKFTNGKIVESLKKELEINIGRIVRKKNTALTQDEVYRLGTELFDSYIKGRLNVAGDPYPFRAFDTLVATNGLDGEVLMQYITKRMEGIDKIEAFYQEFPHYTPIKEYRQYQVSYSEKGSTSVHRFSTDSIDAVTDFVNQSKKLGRILHYKGQGFIDSHSTFGSNRRPSQIMEQLLDAAQDQSLIQLINQMKTKGQIDEQTRIDLMAGIDLWRTAIDSELEGINPGKLIPKDDNKIPRENLDFFEQNLMYMNKVSRLIPARVTDAVFKVEKFNPEIAGDPVQERMLEELNKHIANYRTPDSALGRSFVRGNFLHMMLGNISTIALELSQFPISLSHVMTRNGSGFFDSYRLPMKAMKNLIPYYLQGESGFNSGIKLTKKGGKVVDVYAQLMERGVQDKSIGFGKNQEALEQMEQIFYNLGRIAEGKSVVGSQELAKKFWANLFTLGAKMYQIGPAFNERLTYLSLFDMVHKQKFGGKKILNETEFEAIYQDVWRLSKEANQSAGRFQRPMGLFDQKTEWRTIPMMMHSLNTYNAGLLSSLYNDIRVGLFGKDLKGFTQQQRNQHKLAAFQAFSTLVAGAGVVGALPFVDSFLTLLEDKTHLNPRQAIKNGLMKFGGEEMGPFLSDLATHGLAYAMGAPFDMSDRLAIGGLLGLNPYEGWSAKALMGPTMSRIEDYLNAGGNVLQGNLTGATEKFLPVGLRKSYSLLTKDGRFTDNKGQDLLGQPTFGEQAMYAMGFLPSRLSALREDQRMQQVNERINVERNNRFYRQMVEKIGKEGYASIQQDVMKYAEENQGLSTQSIYSGIEEFLTRQRLGFDPRHTGTRQGSEQRTRNLQQLQGKGLPEISSSQRAMAKIQEMMRMGQPVGDIGQIMKQATLTDYFQRQGNLSFAQAQQQAQLMTSLSYSRQNPQMQLPFLGE